MGIRMKRKKPKLFWLSAFNRIDKILPLSNKAKLKFYLNMSWVFERLSHERSFNYYTIDKHPVRTFPKEFIYKNLRSEYTVLDLGCSAGEITHVLAERVKRIVGIDQNKKAIETAIRIYKRHNLEFHHGEALEFLNNNRDHFDVLFLSHILEHLDQPKEFLLQFKDFFDYIYIELPDFDKTYMNHYRKDLHLKLVYSDADHINEFDRNELAVLLSECSIDILEAQYIFGIQQLWCKVQK